jgi:hypothetical protein
MVRRQDVLRTVIGMVGDSPAQVVLDDVARAAVRGSHRRARRRATPRCSARLGARSRCRSISPRPPLFRARLFRLGDDDHVLFFMTHHAIWDGWSFDLFYEEMADLYGAYRAAPRRRGRAAGDLRRLLGLAPRVDAGPELERQLASGSSKLAGAPERWTCPPTCRGRRP